MRVDNFLRFPIKSLNQHLLTNLELAEQAFIGSPAPTDIYPQTLSISFDTPSDSPDIQINPMWEGAMVFVADDNTRFPSAPPDVSPNNFSSWPLIGDLILHSYNTLGTYTEAFTTHLPFIKPFPNTASYSKVRLTESFIFQTLREATIVRFKFGNQLVNKGDSAWFEKYVIEFLAGRTALWCIVDAIDSRKDTANNPMPVVNVSAAKTIFRVQTASRVLEALDPDWFQPHTDYDVGLDALIVPTAINTPFDQLNNFAHPSHSIISTWALFQNALPTAFVPGTDLTKRLNVALLGPRPDGKVYRRVELVRPPIPGALVSNLLQRPYPAYKLVWETGVTLESQRMPLNGILYLPLADTNYSIWVTQKDRNPSIVPADEEFKLGETNNPGKNFLPLPENKVNFTLLSATREISYYAYLLEFDSRRIWSRFRSVRSNRRRFKSKQERNWGIEPKDWFFSSNATRLSNSKIYGYISESAARHKLAPEFLQAVMMGEGANYFHENGITYNDMIEIDGFNHLGLDEIGESNYFPNKISAGYIDPSFSNSVINPRTEQNEAEPPEFKWTGTVVGWRAAVELVAMELNMRKNIMIQYAQTIGADINILEKEWYITYARFHASLRSAQGHVNNLDTEFRKWTGPSENQLPNPPHPQRRRYFNLIRLTTAKWYLDAEVYR